MKKIIYILFMVIVLCGPFFTGRFYKTNSLLDKANKKTEIKKNGFSRYGAINEDGKEIIPPIYDDVSNFYKGYTIVRKNHKCGIVDSTGKIIVPIKYYRVWRFNGNLAAVLNKNKFAFVDKTGKQVTDLKYDDFQYVEEGFYAVKMNNKWGYINSYGKEVITNMKYDNVYQFKNGRAEVTLNYKKGLIDTNGKEIVPLIYDEIVRLDNGFVDVAKYVEGSDVMNHALVNEKTGKMITSLEYDFLDYGYKSGMPFRNKVARIIKNNKVGLVDENGKLIIPLIYDAIDSMGDMYAVFKNNKYGFVDGKAKIIIPIENDFKNEEEFYDEISGVDAYFSSLLLLSRNHKYGFADRRGSIVTPIKYDSVKRRYFGGAFVSINKKCGYVNENGKETIPAKFDVPLSNMNTNFDEGILIYKENNKWGAIDSTGVNIVKPKYDSMTDFAWEFSVGTIGNKSYLIDKKGKVTQTLKYDKIEKCRAKVALVSIKGKWGVLSKNNKLTTPIKYDKIEGFNNGFAITEMKFNKYGFPISKPLKIGGLPVK